MNMPASMMKIEVQISTMLSRSQHEIKQNDIYIKCAQFYIFLMLVPRIFTLHHH